MSESENILLLMSGSIACAKATTLISAWRKQGHRVRVACTASVSHFVGPATLEGLSGEAVFGDAFESGRAMDHIKLAQWADCIVVCPASAGLLGRLANGLADDAVSTLWLAAWGRGKPLFVVPAMNSHMWDYPATRDNVHKLKRWGVNVLPTAVGDLACGEQGGGRMLEPETIMAHIGTVLSRSAEPGKNILVTGGGTREPIDAVRFIGNHSSGRTAAVLVDELSGLGHKVTWLGGGNAIEPDGASHTERFDSFADLDGQLKALLGKRPYDAVVHAAAVSDFSVAAVESSAGPVAGAKLPSSDSLTVRLRPNPKLLSRLRDYSCNPEIRVIGFKLTVGADLNSAREAVGLLFDGKTSDLVVHNDYDQISDERHAFEVFHPDGRSLELPDSRELARQLSAYLEEAA